MKNNEPKRYWYCLTYEGDRIGTNTNCKASHYVGRMGNYMDMNTINNSKRSAGVKDNSVLLACSYLGHMSEQEFNKLTHVT